MSSSARILLDPRAILLSLTRDQTSPCNIPGYRPDRPPRETMGLMWMSVLWTNERLRGLAVNRSGTGERKLILAMKIPNLSRGVGGCSWEERWESSDEAGCRNLHVYAGEPGLVSSRDTRGGSWLQSAVQRAWMMQTLTLSLLVLKPHYPCKQMGTKSGK